MAIQNSTTPPKGIRRQRVLVAGCGKLGGRIASLLSKPCDVFGLRRQPDKVPPGVIGLGADLLSPDELQSVLPEDLDIVIYCLTPASYDEKGYQNAYQHGLSNLLNALGNTAGKRTTVKRLFFVSSTSVYSQNDDSWVDETSPAMPARFSGEAILEGESLALNSGLPATVVRYSGIYGPTRPRFLEAVIEGSMSPRSPGPFTNRIHEEDAAQALFHLTKMALAGAPLETCYLATDSEPVRLDDIVRWVQERTECAEPAAVASSRGRAGSKRCSNRRLLESGFTLKYPSFRDGYEEMIAQLNAGQKA